MTSNATRTFAAYVITNSAGAIYVGSTGDLQRRIRRHNTGTACDFTRRHAGPWTLIRVQEHTSRLQARLTEHDWHRQYSITGKTPLGPDRVMTETKARRLARATTPPE